jgi:hypothetical protein
MIADDTTWGEGSLWTSKVKCPTCFTPYVALEGTYKVPRHRARVAGNRYSKGSQQVLTFSCEPESHIFDIVFAFHKGETFVGSEAVSE